MHPSIAEPLKVVNALFERAGCPVASGSEDFGVEAHFEALLSDASVRAQVGGRWLLIKRSGKHSSCS